MGERRRAGPGGWRGAACLALAAALLPGCRRPHPGGRCTRDIDCEAHYDCLSGVCVMRPPIAPETIATPAVAAPARSAVAPAPEVTRTTTPMPPTPATRGPAAALPDAGDPGETPSNLPAWQERRRHF